MVQQPGAHSASAGGRQAWGAGLSDTPVVCPLGPWHICTQELRPLSGLPLGHSVRRPGAASAALAATATAAPALRHRP